MSHSAPFQGSVCGPLGRNRRIHRHANLAPALACVAISLGLSAAAHAAPIVWIGGNADWNATIANWNPNDEPDADDEAIFNTPNTVNLANASESILELTLSGGIDLTSTATT